MLFRSAVLGVFVKAGRFNKDWAPVTTFLDDNSPSPETELGSATLNLWKLYPGNQRTTRYVGSLTTPPCSEGVLWNVLMTPIEMSVDQIESFTRYYNDNYRLVQPLNGRTVRVDSTPNS